MRIYQLLPVLAYGDAIGNDTIALHQIIEQAGYETHIYAEVIDQRIDKAICSEIKELQEVNSEDIILYHLSTGSELNYKVADYNCHIGVIYHNITPAEYFIGYNRDAYANCRRGLAGARFLASKVEFAFADSGYNAEELYNMGYRCPIDILPILIAFDDYKKKPSQKIIDQYKDGKTNIIFTGRVAPNKKQEDIIAAFALYKKQYNLQSRLLLVGAYAAMPRYYEQLKQYCEQLGVEDVIFTGHIPFEEILAYYSIADIFLCMSEHEGFCVPLVEAMYYDVPIIAYDSTAIADTLGESGLLLHSKNPALVAGVMNRVCTDSDLKHKLIEAQRGRLADYDHKVIQNKFYAYMEKILLTKKN